MMDAQDVNLVGETPQLTSSGTLKSLPDINEAIRNADWTTLRQLSLLPGGFDGKRRDAWNFLLHITPKQNNSSSVEVDPTTLENLLSSSLDENAQERTHSSDSIHKDERQVGLDTDRSFVMYPAEQKEEKDLLKERLHNIIVQILRKRPKLSYFQGYHDIISVLMLTMSSSEKEDRLFVLPAAEKISLHRLRDAMGHGLEPLVGMLRLVKRLLRLVDPEYAGMLSSAGPLPYYALSNLLTAFSHDVPTLPLIQHMFDYILARPPIILVYLTTAILLARRSDVAQLFQTGDEGLLHAILGTMPPFEDETKPVAEKSPIESATGSVASLLPSDNSESHSDSLHRKETSDSWMMTSNDSDTGASKDLSTSWTMTSDFASSPGTSPSLPPLSIPERTQPSSAPVLVLPDLENASPITEDSAEAAGAPSETSASASGPFSKPFQKLRLTDILKRSDELYEKYPPSRLQVSQIMGPQSVIFTWSENPREMPGDDMAEAMVLKPELVVKEYLDEDEVEAEKEREREAEERRRRSAGGRRKVQKKQPWSGNEGTVLIVVAGVVVAVGVAIAVYGNSRASPNGGSAVGSMGSRLGERWQRVVHAIKG